MCGRVVSATPRDVLAALFGTDDIRTDDLGPRYNVAPTDPLYAVVDHGGRRLLGSFKWGLVAPNATDPTRGPRPINVRAETLLARRTFRDALTHRRCLIPVDGFYEWTTTDHRVKQPYYFNRPNDDPLAFAGLWSVWRASHWPGEELRTCTIVTRPADGAVAELHDRMPASLPSESWDEWLDPTNRDAEGLAQLVTRVVVEPVVARRVSKLVNNVRNDGPELLTAEPDDVLC